MIKHILSYLLIPILALAIHGCRSNEEGGSSLAKKYNTTSSAKPFDVSGEKLTVLFDNSVTSYFIYQGLPAGFEFEMLQRFAQDQKLELNVKVIRDVSHILDSLTAGRGHVAAANLTITKERSEMVEFTKPLLRTRQVLVQRLPDGFEKMTADGIVDHLIRDRLDLENKELVVRANTSYYQNLINFIQETNTDIIIKEAPSDIATEALIEMVSNKEIDFTISDENKALVHAAYFDNIDISTPMSLSEPIAWAVNKKDTLLLKMLNQWISNNKGNLDYNIIKNRYFTIDTRKTKTIKKEYPAIKDGQISPYDELIHEYAQKINWDPVLLTAQIYKESRFDPTIESSKNAVGLMQVLSSTADVYGVEAQYLTNPEANIEAGTAHLSGLKKYWMEYIEDSLEIIKFSLSSYNAGLGHVQDAQRLAEKNGLNPLIFEANVSTMLLNKSLPKYYRDPVVKYGYCRGREPVNYVDEIFRLYEYYTEFTQ